MTTRVGAETVFVDSFTDGILRPDAAMLGPVRDGGRLVVSTAPGCWGPMITPAIRGGHEVTRPVAVDGACVGDAVAIRIEDIRVTSLATASGTDRRVEGRFVGDPFVAAQCPGCKAMHPQTTVVGTGPAAIRCATCGADASPFTFTNGYTIAFDDERTVGVTLDGGAAAQIADDAVAYAALPEGSCQNPILLFAPSDIVGMVARLRPFLGQLGTLPAVTLPDSHNAGDLGSFLIGAPHEFGIEAEALAGRTDGHMDIDAVRAGAVLICPVKVAGGGIYLGDMHALQGDGEIAGHTCDVSGAVTLHVRVIKNLPIDGPILLPLVDDLPFLARPLNDMERERALQVAAGWGLAAIEETAPISVIGTGPTLNAATDNGLERAAWLLNLTVPEIRNRATVTGAVEIGRHPGVVQVTFRAPLDRLRSRGLGPYLREQYGVG